MPHSYISESENILNSTKHQTISVLFPMLSTCHLFIDYPFSFFFSFFPLTHITIISPHARTHKQRTIYSKYLLHQNSHVCLLQIHLLQQTCVANSLVCFLNFSVSIFNSLLLTNTNFIGKIFIYIYIY